MMIGLAVRLCSSMPTYHSASTCWAVVTSVVGIVADAKGGDTLFNLQGGRVSGEGPKYFLCLAVDMQSHTNFSNSSTPRSLGGSSIEIRVEW